MKNVLIIDDEAALCQLIKAYLEKNGDYHADTATSGLDGLKKASEFGYDALLLDVLMPDISGFETFKRIRALPGTKGKLPVIAMSARPSMKDIFQMANIHAFLSKPFSMEQMKQMLDELCGLETSAPAPVPVAAPVPQGPKKVFVAGMEKFMISKVEEYLRQLGYEVVVNYDEHDSVSLATKEKPALILYQFWEESEKFNAVQLFKQTVANVSIQKTPCFVFCPKSGEFEAVKEIPKDKLLTYQDSRELLSKLRSHLPA